MKSVGSYFNKVAALNATTRAKKDVTLSAHPNGMLLEMEEKNIKYSYFLRGAKSLTQNINVSFGAIYGLKNYTGYQINDSEILFEAENSASTPYTFAEANTKKFYMIAIANVEEITEIFNGVSCFAKSGKHVFNQNTFLAVDNGRISVYVNTDITLMKSSCIAKTGKGILLGIDNSHISHLKRWLNYANNPKSGAGEKLYIHLATGALKLQTENCTITVPIMALPTYADIVKSVDAMLSFPFETEEIELDWETLLKDVKSKEEFITVDGEQSLRTYISDFAAYSATKEYEVSRLNTTAKALMFMLDNGLIESKVILMLKDPTKDNLSEEEEEEEDESLDEEDESLNYENEEAE